MVASNLVLYWPIGRTWDAESKVLIGWNLQTMGGATIVIGAIRPESVPLIGAPQKKICSGLIGDYSGGCIRKRHSVEERISVVAVTTRLSALDQGHAAQLQVGLPILGIDQRGYPTLPENSSYAQVILYEQRPLEDISFVLYQHWESREFSDAVLRRLSHSAAVFDALQQIVTVPEQTTGQAKTPAKTEVASHSDPHPLLQFLVRHSLFLCHMTHRNPWRTSPSPQLRNDTVSCTDYNGEVPLSLQQSHHERKSQWIAASDRSTRVLGEVATILLLILCATRMCDDLSFLLQWYRGHYLALTTGLEWLENVPIGLKLNESFLEAIGREVQRAFDVHQWAMEWLFQCTVTHIPPWCARVGVASLVVTGGATGLLAAVFDIYRCLFLHLAVFHWGSQYLFSVELRLLRSSWRLFRGKKRNPLRQRTDTMEYDSMQLLLGTVLFVTVVFLWTTICAYSIFFALLYGVSTAVPLLLGGYYQLLCNGWGCLWLRLRRPGLFCLDVVLRPVDDGVNPCTTLLVARPVSLQSLLWKCLRPPLRTITAGSCRKLLDDVVEASKGNNLR